MKGALARWLGRIEPPDEVYVVCERGVPVRVCITPESVQAVVNSLTTKTIRVHRVPFKVGGEPWT